METLPLILFHLTVFAAMAVVVLAVRVAGNAFRLGREWFQLRSLRQSGLHQQASSFVRERRAPYANASSLSDGMSIVQVSPAAGPNGSPATHLASD